MNKQISVAFKIASIYFIISLFWILMSDNLINLIVDKIEILSFLQTVKGIFFISLTSIIIYLLINYYFKKERKLRENIETIFNNSGIPIVLFTEDGEALHFNKVWLDSTGYKVEEIDNIDKWIDLAFDGNRVYYKDIIESNFNIDKSVNIGEFNVNTKNGDILIWHFILSPFGQIDNKKIFITTVLDVTQLRKKENLLIQQSKMATMGEMIASIAHQWKQPLSLISVSNGLLKLNREYGNFEERVDVALDDIDIAVKNLASTIDDFRNFFNPNKLINNFEINSAIDKTFKLIHSQLINNGIEIIRNIENIEVLAFENELQQVFINIIKNAKDELVKLEQNCKRYIFIDVYKFETNVIIKIKDNANGIKKEIVPRIFDNYFTTKKANEGTGIGLYICKQIIESSMKGSIKAYNEEYSYDGKSYKGAVFEIKLPLVYE